MAGKSFKDLLASAKQSNAYWVDKAVHDFTEDLLKLMDERGVSKAELARRIESTPAYVTKIFRGNANFTIETMVRLARAVDGKICIHVGRKEDDVRWFDIVGQRAWTAGRAANDFRQVASTSFHKVCITKVPDYESSPAAA